MKKNSVACAVVVMGFITACFATPLFADDAATIEMLCSSPWEVSATSKVDLPKRPEGNPLPPGAVAMPTSLMIPWSRVRVFKKDGTFTTIGPQAEIGTWAISGGSVVLTFADKHTDTFLLPLDPNGTDGTDSGGLPTHVVQLPQPAPPATPEVQQKAADLVGAYQKNLVLVSGTEGAGSGFAAVFGKSNFLFTSTDIVAGINNASFKNLDGTVIRGGAGSVAVGRDVFCMAAPAGGAPLEFMQDVDKNAAAGDDVAVLSDAEGGGVVKAFTGKIVSIGPDRIEINAEFVPGNSGSPVIHIKTGKVIGIAARVESDRDPVNNIKYDIPIVRRYACRVDNIKGWQPLDWRSFYAQAAEMGKIRVMTSELCIFFDDLDKSGGKIMGEAYTSPAIVDCFNHWAKDLWGKQNLPDQNRANRTFVSDLRNASQADVTSARQRMTYDYFMSELAEHQKARDAMADGFKKLVVKFTD